MYLNVFRSRKRADIDSAAYAADDARMTALAAAQPGYVSYQYFVAADGETVAISVWESQDHARAWGAHPEHAAVQARGRSGYYEDYTMYVCSDPAVSSFERNAE
jgi:heme-degrading monooxygenase HmoA